MLRLHMDVLIDHSVVIDLVTWSADVDPGSNSEFKSVAARVIHLSLTRTSRF